MYEYFDWYDHDAVSKLRETRNKKKILILKKLTAVKKNGDENEIKKTAKAYLAHVKLDDVLNKKAEETYYYWY